MENTTKLSLSFADRCSSLEQWQQQVRSKFLELINYDNIPRRTWKRLELTETTIEGVLCRRHLVRYGDWDPQPIYEFLPAAGKVNGFTLLSFYGHWNEMYSDPYDYIRNMTQFYDYALELPKRGYRCVTPILYGCMERQTAPVRNKTATEYCREWLLESDRLGVSLLGLRLFDAKLAYEFAKSLPEVEPRRIGCIGLSMGGQISLYLAATEPAIKCCVSAGFLDTFESLLIKSRNCHCYSIRDWAQWFDMPDIVGCIAPRPLLVQKGQNDGCFITEDVEKAVEQVTRIYHAFGSSKNFKYQTCPGGHLLNTDLADKWLKQFLQ
jgi:hypothetical protein